jgi:hypothetical protein
MPFILCTIRLANHCTKPGTAIQCKTKDLSCNRQSSVRGLRGIRAAHFLYLNIYYAIHNTSAQNLSKINAMIHPLVIESLTVNNTTRRRNILSV